MQESTGNETMRSRGAENALENAQAAEIAKRATSIEATPFSTDIMVDMGNAERLPLGQLAALGAGFTSLPEAVRTVVTATETTGEQYLRVTDRFGNPLSAKVLHAFTDGSGFTGSYHNADNVLAQAHFHPVNSQSINSAMKVPYDPTALFMAAALMEINHRLDEIQKTQREMFDYLKNKDKATLRGDLDILRDVLDSYRFNWNNEKYKTNKHALVQSVRKDAAQAIVQHRAEIKRRLGKTTLPIHIDDDTRRKTSDVMASLEEYRLSVYLYGYSSFLEVLLLENFDADYLTNVANKVEGKANDYRALYTEAYNQLEAETESSVRAGVLGGISGAMGMLGKAIEKTPVGDLTHIDETLIDAGKGVDSFSKDVKHDILRALPDACSSDIRPFVSGIEAVNHLYNDRFMFLADEEALYILPAGDAELTAAARVEASASEYRTAKQDAGLEVVASDTQRLYGSAAWCATMQICWDNLRDALFAGYAPMPVNGENELVKALNHSAFDKSMLSDDHYYTYSGPKSLRAKAIIESAIEERFNQTSDVLDSLDWPEQPELYWLFYCMLYRKFAFPRPFNVLENETWGDNENEKACVTYFGIDGQSLLPDTAKSMRRQVHPLFYEDEKHHAVSIETLQGDRVILVRSPEGGTFAEIWDNVQKKSARASKVQRKPLSANETFMCPNISFDLRKEFEELDGVEFQNAQGEPCRINKALQTLIMRLDNEGGEVKSEAVLDVAILGLPDLNARHFAYDGTFALFLVDGNAPTNTRPYLALLVDDIELFR